MTRRRPALSSPALFLDRDGTLVREVGDLASPGQLELCPGAVEVLEATGQAGLERIVITNQAQVARGLLTLLELGLIHERRVAMLEERGAGLEGLYFCPHHPEEGEGPFTGPCRCRKPGPGLFETAVREHDLDPARSLAVGDRLRDLRPAAALGARTVLVRTGHGRAEEVRIGTAGAGGFRPERVVDDLRAVVPLLLPGGGV